MPRRFYRRMTKSAAPVPNVSGKAACKQAVYLTVTGRVVALRMGCARTWLACGTLSGDIISTRMCNKLYTAYGSAVFLPRSPTFDQVFPSLPRHSAPVNDVILLRVQQCGEHSHITMLLRLLFLARILVEIAVRRAFYHGGCVRVFQIGQPIPRWL